MKQGAVMVGGKCVTTVIDQIVSANLLEVECGSTGLMGGDSGHGGRTYIRIEDVGGTDIKVTSLPIFRNTRGNGGVVIELGGDAELLTIIEAFRYIADELEKAAN